MSNQEYWESLFNRLSDEDLENIFVTNQPHECTTCGTFVKVRRTNEMVNSMYAGDDVKYMRNQLKCLKCDNVVYNVIIDKLNAHNKFVAYLEKLK